MMHDKDKAQEQAMRPVDDEGEVAPAMREALAQYFEQLNSGEADPTVGLETTSPEALADWQHTLALLQLPQRLNQQPPSVDAAWQRFRARVFDQTATQSVNLGSYVAQNEQLVIQESGLPQPTLEALKADPTPLSDLKNYQVKDYAALARRYDVEDSLFPRMLKWLKGLGKNLVAPSSGPVRGMVFARDDEPRQPGLKEHELAEELDKQQKE
jgi:hypothetical protein